jgi:hypothetical protein
VNLVSYLRGAQDSGFIGRGRSRLLEPIHHSWVDDHCHVHREDHARWRTAFKGATSQIMLQQGVVQALLSPSKPRSASARARP